MANFIARCVGRGSRLECDLEARFPGPARRPGSINQSHCAKISRSYARKVEPVLVPLTPEGGARVPALRFVCNPVHALYHHLAREARLPAHRRDPLTAGAAAIMAELRQPGMP